MSTIHNSKQRMPIILKPEDEQKWLNGMHIDNVKFPYKVALTARKIIHPNTLLSLDFGF